MSTKCNIKITRRIQGEVRTIWLCRQVDGSVEKVGFDLFRLFLEWKELHNILSDQVAFANELMRSGSALYDVIRYDGEYKVDYGLSSDSEYLYIIAIDDDRISEKFYIKDLTRDLVFEVCDVDFEKRAVNVSDDPGNIIKAIKEYDERL